MKKRIKYYFLYFYRRYYDEYVITPREKNKSFIEYIEDKIKNIIGSEKYNDYIEEVKDNIEFEDLDKIKEIYEEIKSKENRTIEFGIDFEDEDNESVTILKGLYNLFKEKKYFPELSENTKEIINYFKDYQKQTKIGNSYNITTKNDEIIKMDKYLKGLDDIINEIKLYVNEDKNDKNSLTRILNSKLRRLKKYIKNGKNIYIPFIGGSSAGKSTILNCLIGYRLFPESESECTTRGIIIKYGKEVELYAVKVENMNNFYIFEEDRLLSKTVKKVQEYLQCLNYQYGKDESKYFYLIKTPIKFFDDYKFEEEFKKKVIFVDLPGSDTSNNKFNEHDKTERTVYEKLLEISNSFIFINRGRGITNIENKKLLNQAYNVVIDNSSLGKKFLDNCLFVINMFKELDQKDKEISGINNDLCTIIFDNQVEKQKNNINLINSSLFNAKSYMEYLNIFNKTCNKKILLKTLKEEFINKKKKNFTNFCLSSLNTKCKDLSISIDKNYECDEIFYQDIKKEMILIMEDLNLKCEKSDLVKIKKFSNILQYITINIKENKFYINSNCKIFFSNLKKQIYKAKENVEKDFNINLIQSFNYFDILFEKDIDFNKTLNQQYFKGIGKEIVEELDKLESKYEIEKIFDKYLDLILKLIENLRNNMKEFINAYNKQLDKIIKVELEEKTKELLENGLNKEIEEMMLKLDNEMDNIKNKVLELFKKGLKKELEKGKYKAEIDFLINFSFLEKMKIKIYNLFDVNNYKKIAFHSLFSSLLIASGFCLSFVGFIIFGVYSIALITCTIYDRNRKELSKRLTECEEQFQINFSKLRIKFSRIYKTSLFETKSKFKELLALSSADLSKIEEKKWEALIKQYKKIKEKIIKLSKLKINK